MFRMMNEYMKYMTLSIDEQKQQQMKQALLEDANIERYAVTVNFNRYIVEIHVKEFDADIIRAMYERFVQKVQYPYSAISVRYNEGNVIRYRFASCNESKKGFYCDIVFSN